MKKFLFFAFILLSIADNAIADDKIITLDLTKATTELSFNEETGAWTETYNESATSIESQCFSFVHSAIADWGTWYGFTASNSADSKRQENTMKFQFSNMAAGGIQLDNSGKVKLDKSGAPVVDPNVPYLCGFYSDFISERSAILTFNDGKSYAPVGVYINNNSVAYYCMEYGDSFARAFTNGDKFTLTIHGVSQSGEEKEIATELGSYSNGDLTINRGWKYIDLSPLGTVNEIYFTMKSTDSGQYGDNTPHYFCLDKLMVKEGDSGVDMIAAKDNTKISYNRDRKIIYISGAEYAMISDVNGNILMSGEKNSFDLSGLEAGVYVIKAGNKSLKIAK